MSKYEISKAGDEVKDNDTGLIWARCSVGQVWDGNTCVGDAKEMTYNDAMKYAASQEGWRMPTKDELKSIIDKTHIPTIDPGVFPNTPKDWYWSSLPYVRKTNYAWYADFNYGLVYGLHRKGYSMVRLVKGE